LITERSGLLHWVTIVVRGHATGGVGHRHTGDERDHAVAAIRRGRRVVPVMAGYPVVLVAALVSM